MATLAELERQKTEMLALIEGWSPLRLAYHPGPGRWSAAEMFDHIVKVESEIIAAANRGLAHPRRIGLRDRLGTLLLDRLFRSERKVKVPGSAKHVLPESDPDISTVLLGWNRARQELGTLIAAVPPARQRVGIFRHPVAGWMSLPGILGFFSVHLIHHNFQLAHLRDASTGI